MVSPLTVGESQKYGSGIGRKVEAQGDYVDGATGKGVGKRVGYGV